MPSRSKSLTEDLLAPVPSCNVPSYTFSKHFFSFFPFLILFYLTFINMYSYSFTDFLCHSYDSIPVISETSMHIYTVYTYIWFIGMTTETGKKYKVNTKLQICCKFRITWKCSPGPNKTRQQVGFDWHMCSMILFTACISVLNNLMWMVKKKDKKYVFIHLYISLAHNIINAF